MNTSLFSLPLLSLLSLPGLLSPLAAKKRPPLRPNVIYILMDDLGYGELGCYGQEKIETPNIDALARQGLRFTQHYSGSPVSAPARCVLLTGLHTGHAQIRGNDEMASRGNVNSYAAMTQDARLEGQRPLEAGTETLPRLMQRAGYATGCFGKWGLGYPGSEGAPLKQGFDTFYGYNCQRMAHNHYPPFLYRDDKREYLPNALVDPHLQRMAHDSTALEVKRYAAFTGEVYAHDPIFTALTDFVQQKGRRGRPFFAFWATPLPHVSLQAPESWVRHYVEKFGDEAPSDGGGYLPCRYPRATYAAMVSYFDEQVGRLVETLKKEGLMESTLIFFASDNGPTFNGGSDSPWFDSGGPFRSEKGWGKCYVREGGIRVPLIACWPGRIAPGGVTDCVSSFQDMMPTLSALVGEKCPECDGESLLPVLLGQKKSLGERTLYWEYPDAVGQKAVRKGRWKGVLTGIRKGGAVMQLYDLDKDPREEHDLAAKYPKKVKELELIMQREHRDSPNPKFQM